MGHNVVIKNHNKAKGSKDSVYRINSTYAIYFNKKNNKYEVDYRIFVSNRNLIKLNVYNNYIIKGTVNTLNIKD